MDHLVFRLYGPMASWGEIAVGEARHSGNYPGKSAICGLLGAALGVDRQDEEAQQALAKDYLQAVKVLRAGHLLRDYHTAQAPDSVGRFRYRTRRDELVLGKDRLGTVLSAREYRNDAHAIVALQAVNHPRYSLQELQQALREPRFHLYLGRKSCPLSAPLNAQLYNAENLRAALDSYELEPLLPGKLEWQGDSRWLKEDELVHYYWEGSVDHFVAGVSDFSHERIQELVRHDAPLSRQRWQFQPRREFQWSVKPGEEV